jgi:glucan biosynthesis protein C
MENTLVIKNTRKEGRIVFIDYLRAFVTLLVLAHHSCLAYTTFAKFNAAHYLKSSAPIVDTVRWGFLDYAENFNDVYFMSLMFAISGLFVWPLLEKRGVLTFLKDRSLRLGVPFVVGVILLMPLAYYPSWRLAGGNGGYLSYWLQFITKDVWLPGPLWFIWVLLLFDILAALLFLIVGRKKPALTIKSPLKSAFIIFIVTFLAWAPLAIKFGEGTWVPFLSPPFFFQLPRIGLYFIWFIVGILIGMNGIKKSILAPDGPLARRWLFWIVACVIVYNLLWFVPGKLLLQAMHAPTKFRDLTYGILWILSCTTSCYGLFALFSSLINKPRPWLDNVARFAFIMYIVHYVYLTWAQYFLLNISLPAALKFIIVFVVVVALSMLSAKLLLKSQKLASIL